MKWLEKVDNFWMGLLIGLFFPFLFFTIYWLLFYHNMPFPKRFIHYLMKGYMLSGVIKICGLGNLLLFYLSLNNKADKFSKGVVVSVLFYVVLIAYVTYYLEPELI